MAKWRSFGDRILPSIPKSCNHCPHPTANFHHPTTAAAHGIFLSPLRRAPKPWLLSCSILTTFHSFTTTSCQKTPPTFPRIPDCSRCDPPSLPSSPLQMLLTGSSVTRRIDEVSDTNEFHHFFDVWKQNEFRVENNLTSRWQRDLLMTPTQEEDCVGSCRGWLAFYYPYGHYYLYNPLLNSPNLPYIPLPPLENDSRYFKIEKLVMSSTPSPPSNSCSFSSFHDCTIMAICSTGYYSSTCQSIVFRKPGEDKWTKVPTRFQFYGDIMYFTKDRRFYGLQYDSSSIEAWVIRFGSCLLSEVFAGPAFCPGKFHQKIWGVYNSDLHSKKEKKHCSQKNYLVESEGELLLVCRFLIRCTFGDLSVARRDFGLTDLFPFGDKLMNETHKGEKCWTLGFDVHRFDFDHNKWEVLECLGDRALFVGYVADSFSLSVRDYPELRENSVYFTNDVIHGDCWSDKRGNDNGVFCLDDYSINPYNYPKEYLKKFVPAPIWVAPQHNVGSR